MAKNIANYLGLKLIKPLPFQALTQLPVGVFGLFLFLHWCSYLFSVASVLVIVCFPLQVLDDASNCFKLGLSWRPPSPHVSALPGKPGLHLKCIKVTGQLHITKLS